MSPICLPEVRLVGPMEASPKTVPQVSPEAPPMGSPEFQVRLRWRFRPRLCQCLRLSFRQKIQILPDALWEGPLKVPSEAPSVGHRCRRILVSMIRRTLRRRLGGSPSDDPPGSPPEFPQETPAGGFAGDPPGAARWSKISSAGGSAGSCDETSRGSAGGSSGNSEGNCCEDSHRRLQRRTFGGS